ncbi:uncharacterized protein LOC134532748 isoform X1 [Bacillus rossius redtenbacheri]|uniref:uncharacterized protein LOC134532748 isoform X1 n=1 Tax=Bacillus rossius redtenbacheri TaxID=93214 RepID=UPI002FDD633A
MIPDRIIKKIPGQPPPSVREKQGYIEDLSSLPRHMLLELIDRQNKLIGNKAFISKLPDKGARIVQFREKLLTELTARDKVDDACGLLSKLSLTADELEWQKKGDKLEESTKDTPALDSDDESEGEVDPLKIIATHSGTTLHKKQHRFEKPERSLVKPGDIAEDAVDGYVKALCGKLEQRSGSGKRERFRPNRTLRSSVDAVASPPRKPHHWEVTAATPPPLVHDEVRLVSLQESFELQKQQASRLQEVQARHATERLKALAGLRTGEAVPGPAARGPYRDARHSDSSSSSSSEDEGGGEEEEEPREKDTAVMYSLVDA